MIQISTDRSTLAATGIMEQHSASLQIGIFVQEGPLVRDGSQNTYANLRYLAMKVRIELVICSLLIRIRFLRL